MAMTGSQEEEMGMVEYLAIAGVVGLIGYFIYQNVIVQTAAKTAAANAQTTSQQINAVSQGLTSIIGAATTDNSDDSSS